jgi:hypothetical protein
MANKKTNKSGALNQRHSLSRMQLLTFAVVFGVIGGLISWAAFAAPLHQPGGGTATVSASPDPSSVGSKVVFSGCGYDLSPAMVNLTSNNGYSSTYYISMASPGCFDTNYWVSTQSGSYTVKVYQKSSTHKNATYALKASGSFTVQ